MTRTRAFSCLAVVLLGLSTGCGGGGGESPPTQNQYGLTVNRGGTGQGTVNGPGIACGPAAGSACSNTFAAGTVVTLTASASAGSSFTGWSGPCSGTGNCVLTMNAVASVTANFTLGGRMLTVTAAGGGTGSITSSPAGISCPGTCSAGFADGAVVTLTALAGGASTFGGWSGACTGTGLCNVTLSADTDVTATFLPGPGSLNVVMAGTGSGTVTSVPAGVSCPATACSPTFPAGTVVTLTAAATTGSTFTGWSGPCTGSGDCVITMSGTATVTATFTATIAGGHTITVATAGNGAGTVTSSPAGISCPGTCSATFASGSVILTATPAAGSVLAAWSGACNGTGATCSTDATMDRSTSVTFSRPVLTITTNGDGAGRITSTPAGIDCSNGSSAGCSASFDQGASVTLTSTPSATSSFPGWPDPCFGVRGPCTFTMSSDRSLSIVFSGWTAVRPFPTSLYGAAELGATRIAVGGGGAVITSTDSISWTGHPIAVTQTLRGVATDTGAGIAVAVGDLGTILTSADGISWTSRTSGTTVALHGVARGAGLFVAVGSTGVILTSADGISWAPRTSPTSENLMAVTFGGELFVATGVAGTIVTSADGLAWTSRSSNTTQMLTGVTLGLNGFVAVGSAGAVVTSSDAVAWTSRGAITIQTLVGVTARSGTYAAADADKSVYTSTDGITWTAHLLDPSASQYLWSDPGSGIVTLGGEFVTLSLHGALLRSTDGVAWTLALVQTGAGPAHCRLADAAYGNSTYVAVGCYGSVFTSPDGVTWTSRRADLHASNAGVEVAFGADTVNAFVAVSLSGIIRSADGITWSTVAGPPGQYGGSIVYQPGQGFVAVGLPSYPNPSPILTSTDGTTWTTQSTTGITTSLEAISCSASRCVALGASGASYYTHSAPGSGSSWIPRIFPVANSGWQSGIEFGNSVFVVPVEAATYTSADGTNWTGPNPVSPATGKVRAFGNGTFMANNLVTSADGVTWSSMTGPTVAGGPNGTLQVSALEGAAYGSAGWVGIANLWEAITVDGFFVFMKHP